MENKMKLEIVFGRLGDKPDLRYTQKQEPVCTLSVAEKSENEEVPTWHKVIVFGKQAELCSLYLKKGSAVFVQGRRGIREYINKEGAKRTINELKAQWVGFALN